MGDFIEEKEEQNYSEYLENQAKELQKEEEQKKVQIKILEKELEIINLKIQANLLKR